MKPSEALASDLGTLAEDARALLTATADMAGEQLNDARRRLATTLDGGKTIVERAKGKALDGARATSDAVHDHPYQAIGIAFGIVALVGYLVSRRFSQKG